MPSKNFQLWTRYSVLALTDPRRKLERGKTDPMSFRPFRVAVIGAGPSGFYTAEALLKSFSDVSVELIDRLPTPFGLVRYGVAPDHQKIKSVTKMFERTLQDERVRFLGNVEYGRDLTHEDVTTYYDAVVYTVGASADRSLDTPG
ncbi:hypothetical protein BH24DEI2_BH24DEI2_27370 [soil metagenome]